MSFFLMGLTWRSCVRRIMMKVRQDRSVMKMRINVCFALFCILLAGIADAQLGSDKIEKGDIIEIRVYGHDELSRNIMVQPDGTINHPLVADIPIDGLRLDEFREVLIAQASKYLGERPIVTVQFAQTMAVSVTVLGMVQVPGEYRLAKNATVQGAITRAGGSTPRGRLDEVRLIRTRQGKRTTQRVNLYAFYYRGDPDLVPSLEEGDIIVVPGLPGTHDVRVLGEVNNPGSYNSYLGATVLDMIYFAGGPTENANMKKVRLISPMDERERERTIDIPSRLASDNFQMFPIVSAGDVIIVGKKINAWQAFIGFMRDISAIVAPLALILYYSNR